MQFVATHQRVFSGNNISVQVNAGSNESIQSVEVDLDGSTLDSQDCEPGTESYTRDFSDVGSASPGEDHTVVVKATDQNGTPHSATMRWTDTN